jgi:hypothetical protein
MLCQNRVFLFEKGRFLSRKGQLVLGKGTLVWATDRWFLKEKHGKA